MILGKCGRMTKCECAKTEGGKFSFYDPTKLGMLGKWFSHKMVSRKICRRVFRILNLLDFIGLPLLVSISHLSNSSKVVKIWETWTITNAMEISTETSEYPSSSSNSYLLYSTAILNGKLMVLNSILQIGSGKGWRREFFPI